MKTILYEKKQFGKKKKKRKEKKPTKTKKASKKVRVNNQKLGTVGNRKHKDYVIWSYVNTLYKNIQRVFIYKSKLQSH